VGNVIGFVWSFLIKKITVRQLMMLAPAHGFARAALREATWLSYRTAQELFSLKDSAPGGTR
jgi:hypothetical protein